MKYQLYLKSDPVKKFHPMSNKVRYIGLSYDTIAGYRYLLHIENRKTLQNYASHNILHKYLSEQEDKQLIRTEPTIITNDGRGCDRTLYYRIHPIQKVVNHYIGQ